MALSIVALSYRHIVGPILQSCALTASSAHRSASSSSSSSATSSSSSTDLSCDTRAVNLVVLFIVLLFATLLSAAAPYRFVCVLLPAVHVDLLFHLLTRLLHTILWARRLAPSELFYLDEIFPLQVASTIWNDCRSVSSSPSHNNNDDVNDDDDDMHLVFTAWIRTHVALWTPVYARRYELVTRLPVFVLLRGLTLILSRVERMLFMLWHYFFHSGVTNRFPIPISGKFPHVVGHAMLLSERQLTWLQRFVASLLRGHRATASDTVLRVGLQAVHCANLLNMPGHTRLMENAPGGIAMNELYAGVTAAGARAGDDDDVTEAGREDDIDGEGIKTLLSMYNELDILHDLPNGNRTKRGCAAPRQVVWARLVVGAAQSVRARPRLQPQPQATRHHRWRCAIAMAQFTVAQGNVTAAQTRSQQQQPQAGAPGASTVSGTASRTAIQRHVYSVLRRWLVDWVVHVWWHGPLLSSSFVDPVNPDLLFARVRSVLYANIAGNTRSLAHAVGELASSVERMADVEAMLACVLGNDWQDWWNNCRVTEDEEEGERVGDIVERSQQWKCSGRQVNEDDCVDAQLYGSLPLEEAVVVREGDDEETRARAVIVARVAAVLVARVRAAWDNLPDDVTGLG